MYIPKLGLKVIKYKYFRPFSSLFMRIVFDSIFHYYLEKIKQSKGEKAEKTWRTAAMDAVCARVEAANKVCFENI